MKKVLYSILFACIALQLQVVYSQEEGNDKKKSDRKNRPRGTTLPDNFYSGVQSETMARKNNSSKAELFHSQPLVVINQTNKNKALTQKQLLQWEAKRIATINENHLQNNPSLPEELKKKRKSDIQSLMKIAQASNPEEEAEKTKLLTTKIRPQGIKFKKVSQPKTEQPKTESK